MHMVRNKLLAALSLGLIAAMITAGSFSAAPADARIADAAMRDDIDAVRSLLKQAEDVNTAQGDGMTALHWAAVNTNRDLAQLLLYAGANVRATTRLGITPVHLAAEAGSAPLLELLIASGADGKLPTSVGLTPLMLAATSGEAEAVNVLLKNGAEPNVKEKTHGQTALMFAAANNRDKAITALLAGGADAKIATKVVQPPAAAAFLGGGRGQRGQAAAQPPAGGAPAAAGRGSAAAAGAPAAAPGRGGAPGQGRGAAPAQQAQNNMDEGPFVAPDASGGMTPLLYAAREGQTAAVKALLDGGADINAATADRTTPLMIAAINGKFDTALYLLERGANPQLATVANGTPLYGVINVQWAPKVFYPQPTFKLENTSHLELMRALLDRGADPNAKLSKDLWYTGFNGGGGIQSTGATPFWRASYAADLDAMKLLISRGANPNLSNANGVTPMMAASGVSGKFGTDEVVAPHGRMAAVVYLVEELQADVNAADRVPGGGGGGGEEFGPRGGGITALHNAASRGDNEMILYLVSKGAKVDAVTRSGQTVADMANGPIQRVQPYGDTVALLQLLGSRSSHKCVSC
jgi:uncharacterized protein